MAKRVSENESYENLLFAIVQQAAMDYAAATIKIHNDEIGTERMNTKAWIKAKCTQTGCEMFIREEIEEYGIDIDPDYLLKRVEKDAEESGWDYKALKKKYSKEKEETEE